MTALTVRQQLGIDCAWCGSYLGGLGRDLGAIWDGGRFLYLYGCAPRCSLPRRNRTTWGPTAPVLAAGPEDSCDNSTGTARRVLAGLRDLPDDPPGSPRKAPPPPQGRRTSQGRTRRHHRPPSPQRRVP